MNSLFISVAKVKIALKNAVKIALKNAVKIASVYNRHY